MKSAFKNTLRNWLPPIFVRWLIKLKNAGNRFYGDYATWEEAEEKCSGYSAEKILEKVLASTIKVKMVMLFMNVIQVFSIILNTHGRC